MVSFIIIVLSHNSHFDVDGNVSTTYCKTSSGERVDLLCETKMFYMGMNEVKCYN